MTRKEASFYLANMDRKHMEKGTSEALDMAIQALSQEPKTDMLDKMRAEILNFKEKCNASDYLGCGILEIIDKYK